LDKMSARPSGAAVDLVAGYPCGLVAGVQKPGGRTSAGSGSVVKVVPLGEARGAAAAGVVPGRLRCGRACLRNQGDGDLRVLDPAGGSGVSAPDADRARALLHIAGLVDDQHRPVVVRVLHHVAAHVVADLIGIPLGPAQRVPHAVRSGLASPVGDGPAVLARQAGQ
jgi:hypothetical protein